MDSCGKLTMKANSQVEEDQSILLKLPNEILAQIVEALDSMPPSLVKANEKPDACLSISRNTYVKSFSGASRKLRVLTAPYLFRHARVRIDQIDAFLSFVSRSDLNDHVATVIVTLAGSSSQVASAWWLSLLNEVSLTVLMVHGAPDMFSAVAQLNMDISHTWAFNMPCHTLTLSQSLDSAKWRTTAPDACSLLAARPWTGLRYNEGSSLTAYATYEYFLKRTPSLLVSLSLDETDPGIGITFFGGIETFSFVAIFPFYNHVDEVLKCTRHMKKLKHLFIKLCPEPESTVLAEEIAATNGHIDVNDPWNEFDTACTLISFAVKSLAAEGSLETLEMDDAKIVGIRDSLESSISDHLQEAWLFEGNGIWRRQKL